jgi:hypothetical protein
VAEDLLDQLVLLAQHLRIKSRCVAFPLGLPDFP